MNMMKPLFAFPRTQPCAIRRSEHGATLVVGLVILLLLTLLGVQAMRSNTLQERMAGNTRDRNLAFQAAETALRVGEARGTFSPQNPALDNPVDWVGSNVNCPNQSGVQCAVIGFDAGVAQAPSYVVGAPQRVRVGVSLPPEFRLVYPVTARGTGGQADSVVILQSHVEPPN